MRVLALIFALLMPFPVAALTPAEAAARNVQLAMSLCFQNYHDPANLRPAFMQAGFAYEPENFAGEIVHWFHTPGYNVNVMVLDKPGAVECRISTPAYGVEQMHPFIRAVLATLFNGDIHEGAPEGQNILPGSAAAQQEICSGYHLFAPRSLIWVKLARAGNDGTCVSDGTSQIIMIL